VLRGGGSADEVRILADGEVLATFTAADDAPFSRVLINGGPGDDMIRIDRRLRLAAEVTGGAGNDRLDGGQLNDILLGGACF
jgi:Ca2+-binding RTX toxin-like protein